MIKKVRFPLEMKDGRLVKSLEELREFFDLNKSLIYLNNGRLKEWLEARYYIDEAERIKELMEKDNKDLSSELMQILGVSAENQIVDSEHEKINMEKLNRLKQYTDDENVLKNVNYVAFNQEELADLLDEGVNKIYLCGQRFSIPLTKKNKEYVGITGKETVVVNSKETVDFQKLQIVFINIHIDDEYKTISKSYVRAMLNQGVEEEKKYNFGNALKYYEQAAELGNLEALEKSYDIYYSGRTIIPDLNKAKILKENILIQKYKVYPYEILAMKILGDYYSRGAMIYPNEEEAKVWRQHIEKAKHKNTETEAMEKLLGFYSSENKTMIDKNVEQAIEWYDKASDESAESCMRLGTIYEYGQGDVTNIKKAIEYYQKGADLGNEKAKERASWLKTCYGFL